MPTPAELLATPLFDQVRGGPKGDPVPVGEDDAGNEVYVLGRGRGDQLVVTAFLAGYRLAGGRPEEVLLVDTLPCVNLLMRVGGYLSRRLGWVWIGRPLVVAGTRRAYPNLVGLVRNVRRYTAQPARTSSLRV